MGIKNTGKKILRGEYLQGKIKVVCMCKGMGNKEQSR